MSSKATPGDILIVTSIVLGSAVLVGALMGYASNRFGLPGSVRVPIMISFLSLVGFYARRLLRRRMEARAAAAMKSGVK